MAALYGFEIVGLVIPSLATHVEPSAEHIAGVVDVVREHDIPAVFGETTVSERLAQTIATETGAQLVRLFSGSLGPEGSGGDTYLGMVRTNVERIVGGTEMNPIPDGGASMSLQDVTVEFDGQMALSNVSFDVEAGTLMGVVGPNGAGKSTLFNAIAGLLPVRRGKVTLHRVDQGRGALAYVPQRGERQLAVPCDRQGRCHDGPVLPTGVVPAPRKRDRELVDACLYRVGLWDHRSALMTELSGGQRQRVFVARALTQEASVLLLDEAFSGV